jgi:hypothetical protein
VKLLVEGCSGLLSAGTGTVGGTGGLLKRRKAILPEPDGNARKMRMLAFSGEIGDYSRQAAIHHSLHNASSYAQSALAAL